MVRLEDVSRRIRMEWPLNRTYMQILHAVQEAVLTANNFLRMPMFKSHLLSEERALQFNDKLENHLRNRFKSLTIHIQMDIRDLSILVHIFKGDDGWRFTMNPSCSEEIVITNYGHILDIRNRGKAFINVFSDIALSSYAIKKTAFSIGLENETDRSVLSMKE